jgi:hypothetical protein
VSNQQRTSNAARIVVTQLLHLKLETATRRRATDSAAISTVKTALPKRTLSFILFD